MGSLTLAVKLALLVVFLSAITCSSEIVKFPMGSVVDMDVKDYSRRGITFVFNVSLVNPFDFRLPVVSQIEYFLKRDRKVIVGGNYTSPPELKANSKTHVPVDIKMPRNVLISLAKDLPKDLDFDYEVGMRVRVLLPVVGDDIIPIVYKGEMKLLTWKALFLAAGVLIP